MQQVQLGQKVQPVGISRASISANCWGSAFLLDPNPRVKQIAFDQELSRSVEVDQEACIKLHLTPRTLYYFLIARLDTDIKGNVVSDKFIVQYIQWAPQAYTNFLDLVETNKNFYTLRLKRQQKNEGDQYGYLFAFPSTELKGISEILRNNITRMRKDKALIENLWSMIDSATSMPLKSYLEALQKAGKNSADVEEMLAEINASTAAMSGFGTGEIPATNQAHQIAAPQQAAPQQTAPQQAAPQQAAPTNTDGFGGSDYPDFDSDGDDFK